MPFLDSILGSQDPATLTPNMLAARRARANAVAQRIGWGTPSIGQGVGDIFRGLGAGFANYRADQAEQAGNTYGQSAVNNLSNILSQPPQVGMTPPPSNDAVGAAIKSGISSGQTPQLAVYTPPQGGQGPDAGLVQPNRPPSTAPMAYPGGDGITSADQGGGFAPNTANGPIDQTQAQPVPQPMPASDTSQSPAPMVPASNSSAMIPQIKQILRNPWVSDSDKAILQKRLETIQQQADPAYQQKMQLGDIQLQQAKQNLSDSQGADLKTYSDPVSGDLYSYDAADPKGTMTLVRKADPTLSTKKPTPAIQEYEYAKATGFKGSIADYENAKAGRAVGTNDSSALPQLQLDAQGNVDPASQQEFLSKLAPDDARAVKGMIEYRLDPTKFASLRGNERQRLVDLATAADPTFDLSQFKSRQAFKNSLTSGNLSQALMSSNLVIQHMDALLEAADKMDNGSYPLLNSGSNFFKTQSGQNEVTNFKTAKKAVAAELAKVFKGVGATDVNSINEWESNFSEASSPEQIRGAVETATKLLASRIDTVKNQYQSTMGKPMDFRFLTPKSEAVLAKRGLDVGATTLPDMAAQNQNNSGLDPTSNGQPRPISDDAGYNALPSGTLFKGPDGQIRKKP